GYIALQSGPQGTVDTWHVHNFQNGNDRNVPLEVIPSFFFKKSTEFLIFVQNGLYLLPYLFFFHIGQGGYFGFLVKIGLVLVYELIIIVVRINTDIPQYIIDFIGLA